MKLLFSFPDHIMIINSTEIVKFTNFNMKKYYFLILLLISLQLALGQTPALNLNVLEKFNTVIPSPNAASLGKFGEFPVGYYTGIPNIGIPIYDLNVGDIKIPIALNYNAVGIKVDEISSDVGLGWSLNAGGMITRTVVGIPDEKLYEPGYNFYNDPYTMTMLNNDWHIPSKDAEIRQKLLKISVGKRDGSSDIYHFNFAGKSGKFVYNQDSRSFVSLTDPSLRITIETDRSPSYFQIIDGNGIVYSFSEIEYTPVNVEGTVYSPVPTTWYLTSIYNPVTDRRVYLTYIKMPNGVTNTSLTTTQLFGIDENGNYAEDSNDGKTVSQMDLIKLSKIETDWQTVDFNYGQPRYDLFGDFSLESIVIKENGEETFTYRLFQTYFNVGMTPTPNIKANSHLKRLRLDSVQCLGYSNTMEDPEALPKKRYSFKYNELICPLKSYAQDYWGYYNKAFNSNLFEEANYLNFTKPGADRKVSPGDSQMGMIKEFKNPMGATTYFEFENNKAVLVESNKYSNGYVGGHRIKKIITIDALGDVLSNKYYTYNLNRDPNVTSGRAQLFQIYNTKTIQISSNGVKRMMRRMGRSIIPLVSDQGTSVGYKEVQEYNIDNKLGYNNYKFTSYDDYPDENGEGRVPIYRPGFNDVFRGKMLSKEVFDKDNVLRYKEVYDYDFNYSNQRNSGYDNAIANGKVATTHISYLDDELLEVTFADPDTYPGAYAVYQDVPLFKYFVPTKRKLEINYSSNGNDTTATVFGYNDKLWLTNKMSILNSNGDTTITRNYFPIDFNINVNSLGSRAKGVYRLLSLNKVVDPLVTVKDIKKGASIKTLESIFYSYRADKPLVDTIFRYRSLNANLYLDKGGIELTNNTLVRRGDFVPEMIFHRYDKHGNISEYERYKGPNKSIIYGYNYRFPVILAENIAFDSISNFMGGNSAIAALGMGNSDNANFVSKVRSLQEKFKTARIQGYSYNRFGLTKTIMVRGIENSFEYDALGRLSIELDHELNLTKSYAYKYSLDKDWTSNSPRFYYNQEASKSFTKNNCSSGLIGSQVVYVVPAKKYVSYISQQDANNQAQNEINTFGQSNANSKGTCTTPQYGNQIRTGSFAKSDCSGDERVIGETIQYVVPASRYKSSISIAHANSLADQEIQSRGQHYADSIGTCLVKVDIGGIYGSYNLISGIKCYDINNQIVYEISPFYDTNYNSWCVWLRPGSYSRIEFHFSNLDQPSLPAKIRLQYRFNSIVEFSTTLSTGGESTVLSFPNIEINGYEYGSTEIDLND